MSGTKPNLNPNPKQNKQQHPLPNLRTQLIIFSFLEPINKCKFLNRKYWMGQSYNGSSFFLLCLLSSNIKLWHYFKTHLLISINNNRFYRNIQEENPQENIFKLILKVLKMTQSLWNMFTKSQWLKTNQGQFFSFTLLKIGVIFLLSQPGAQSKEWSHF